MPSTVVTAPDRVKNSAPPKKRRPPMLLRVEQIIDVSKSLRRFILSGDDLKGFPEDKNGSHIKAFFARQGQDFPVMPKLTERGIVWPKADLRPITRTYTVRYYDSKTATLAVDFALHGDTGPASSWALKAKIGDLLGIAGPGGPDPLLAPAQRHILAGDLTALPAISALLEQTPAQHKLHVLVEVPCREDIHPLPQHPGAEIHWFINSASRTGQLSPLFGALKAYCQQLSDYLAAFEQADTTNLLPLSGFIAGENSTTLALRDYLREQFNLKKSSLYAIPYWRKGQDEEAYHQQRHTVMDQEY